MPESVLVYGAGAMGLLYLANRKLYAAKSAESERIVGFIDDNAHLHRKTVHGYPVLGGLKELPAIAKDRAPTLIIVTCSLNLQRRQLLVELTERLGVKVREWKVSQVPIADEVPILVPSNV